MGADQAFAAQMWNWPDAVIKRDSAGAVLFVNAAFLGLYGGRAEDWHGMGVTGWSNPPAPQQSHRFETRMVDATGSERIYDWIESADDNGSALALAREVSGLVDTHTTPAPVAEQAPAHQASSHQAPPAAAPQDAPAFAPAFQAPAAEDSTAPEIPAAESYLASSALPGHVEDAHVPVDAPAPAVDAAASPLEPVFEMTADAPSIEAPAARTSAVQTPAAEMPAVEAPAIEAPAAQASAPDVAVTEAPTTLASAPVSATPEREFERRALPIEDGSAVLGNNWRDAVIAKAVGAGEPAAAEAETPAASPSAAPAPVSSDGIRILLAEDNAINALLTRTLLEAEGCKVDTVEDGALAVEAMRNTRYDLIFMDMRMPNMDGLEATRKIRSMDHRSKGLPIIALTANAFDDDRNACFDAGMNDFMTKPVSAEELSEMVSRWTSEEARKLAAVG